MENTKPSTNEQFATGLAGIFPCSMEILRSMQKLTDRNDLSEFIKEQFRISDIMDRNVKKKPSLLDVDSDEELKAELESAAKNYRRNRRKGEPEKTKLGIQEAKRKNTDTPVSVNLKERTNSTLGGINENGDPYADMVELINYFFGSRQHQNLKRDYEKEGAIPKGKVKNQSRVAGLLAGFHEAKLSKFEKNINPVGPECNDEIEKISEDTCNRPFYYVVPENPSPNFFLPRGSYYVIPGAPDSSTDEQIVFHPERGNSNKNRKKKGALQIYQEPAEVNNLDKDTLLRTDSHLNIGPLDVKKNEASNNLETNCGLNKVYCKPLITSNSFSPAGEQNDPELMNDCDGAICEAIIQDDKLEEIINELTSEFPDMKSADAELVAEKYLNDELGLEGFIAAKRMQYKIRGQLEKLAAALPESNFEELEEKCNEFKGDEALVNDYIKKVQRENHLFRRVMELQYIFPDADLDFLRERVEELSDNDDSINLLTAELLENNDYPKIPKDSVNAEKRRLWNTYVKEFNVKNYVRNVEDPEYFMGLLRSKKRLGTDLVYKYLQAKYPHSSSVFLKDFFRKNGYDLSNTCAGLDSTESKGVWENSIKNEDFDEDLLKEIAYVEHKKEIDRYLKEINERREIEIQEALINGCFLACPLCADDELVASDIVPCPEGHVFCRDCIKKYIILKMADAIYKFVCPTEKCGSFFTLKSLEDLLPDTVFLNIIKKQQAEEISVADVEGLETCPYCEFAYIPNPDDKIFKCQNPACLMETCRNCRENNHIPLRCEEIERPMDVEARKTIEEAMTAKLVRVCPHCKKKVVKIDGCNKISCSCGALFCYICRERISDYTHFNGDSKRCPLYSKNDELHVRVVQEAGVAARNEILQRNPNVRILYDPTVN